MAASRPRVFTIPPSAPFLPTLAAALLDGTLVPGFAPRGDPLALASATVFLPTRRAARALAAAILQAAGGEATTLPRIVPLGDVDEDALAFAEDAALVRPPAADPLTRKLLLARLVRHWAAQLPAATGDEARLIASSPAAAVALADSLARLFDDLIVAGVSFDHLRKVVPPELDVYWQKSFEFLQIAHQGWFTYLAERGLADPTQRRDELIAREAERITADGNGPVIAAGSTGSLPAVARLLAAIAQRPDGAVVLPGLDRDLDAESYALIDGSEGVEPSPGHPQFGLKRLLGRLKISRSEVELLATPAAPAREKLLSEAFRPAATTDRWRDRANALSAGDIRAALADVTLVEAGDPREEALSVALILRETLQDPGKTAALVTPDRSLARRVVAELARWNIAIDDSAGAALAATDAGRLARLAVSAAAERLAPLPLLALLRHRLAQLASAAEIDALERAVLRGPRPAAGADGLARGIAELRLSKLHKRDARAKVSEADWQMAADLAARIGRALEPLLALAAGGPRPFAELVRAHETVLATVGPDLAASTAEDVEALAKAFKLLANASADAPAVTLSEYADMLPGLLAEPHVRPPFDPHTRVRILGPLEARLLDVDRIVLAGLNEGSWPPDVHSDAWLNRPMRRALQKLDLPERRIGLAAHDFVQSMGAGEVVLTRAQRDSGVETVQSRFLHRLSALVPEAAWDAVKKRGDRYLALVREFEHPPAATPIERPRPTPPLAARPSHLSVSEIEDLVRDPYTIYARHVLGLTPLEQIDAEPGARERGTLLHDALARFVEAHPDKLPPDALAALLAIGRRTFAALDGFPGIQAVWWPRFERVAEWFVGREVERRQAVARTRVETGGRFTIELGDRSFTLSARADRIDLMTDGSVTVLDYKTGEPPGVTEALVGLAPQLPLEAAIARRGGFDGIAADTPVSQIAVVRLSGGNPPGKVMDFDFSKGPAKKTAERLKIVTLDDFAEHSLARLTALLLAFARLDQPYHSMPRPKWRLRYSAYDHLARVKEWSIVGDDA
jgi:ATP-dependent helicase/nuclease subunit B